LLPAIKDAIRITGSLRDIATFKLAFLEESANYYGATGNTTLHANGDRAD